MEVVGLIASSVTLLEVSLKTVGFFQEMATVQDDFRCLKEVVADIESIVQASRSIPCLFAQGSGLPQVAEPILMARAKSQLEHLKDEMDEVITNCTRSSDSDGSSKAKKRRWILVRNRIPKLFERARDARSNFQTAIQVHSMALDAIRAVREQRLAHRLASSSSGLRHVGLIAVNRTHLELKALIQELHPIQQLAHSNEQEEINSPPVEDEEEKEGDEGEDEDSGEETTQRSISPAPSIRGLDVIGVERSYPIGQAETAVIVRTQNPVSRLDAQGSPGIGPMEQPCRCRTQRHWNRYQAPAWLQPIIGKWNVHHSPGQDSTRPPSSNCRCHSTESLCLNVEGLLPAWTVARTLLLKVAFNSSGLTLALRPARFIDPNDDVRDWAVAGTRSETYWMTNEWIYFPEDYTLGGRGLMQIAISCGQFSVVEALLARWQNILQHRKFGREVAFRIHWRLANMELEERDAEVLKRVLLFVEDAPVWGESTLVHEAAITGHGIKEALDKEPRALNEADYTGQCPIHIASVQGNKHAVEDLIQANASVNMKDFMGCTALMLASFYGHVDCVRLLLRHSDIKIDQRDNDGRTALSHAARSCGPEVAAALLEGGASVSIRDIDSKSPLHYLGLDCTNHAMIKQTLRLFLASGKINIDAVDDNGLSPLMHAIVSNRVAPLRCLVEAGASLQLLDKYGRNVLHGAATSDLDVLQYLLGLDPTMFRGISPNQPNIRLYTPWDDFQSTLSPDDVFYRVECSHEASKASFAQLLQIAQDENLRWEIEFLEFTLAYVRQSRVDEARSQLNSMIVQRKKWKEDERARYCRGINQQIQAGDFKGVITALEEDIEDLGGQIGSSPWLEDSDSSWSDSSDIASSEEEDDQTAGGEDGGEAYETAESRDEAGNEDTGTAL